MHSKVKLTLEKTSLKFRPSHPLARTPDMAVNRPKRKLWSRRSRTSPHPLWSKVVSKLKAKSPREVSSPTRNPEEEAVVVVELVEAVVEEVDLATLLTVKRKNIAQEPKVEKEEVEKEEVVAEEVTTVPLVLKVKVRIKLQIPARKVRESHSEESPEKMPTLSIANQELDVERETNKSLEVAVDNGVMPSKISPKVLKVKKPKRLKKPKKSQLKKPRLKSLSQSPLLKKSPMFT